jgi:pSer/pThr/pTyr-binding forkhead associated (FHA) protein
MAPKSSRPRMTSESAPPRRAGASRHAVDFDDEVIPTSIYSPDEASRSTAQGRPAFLYVERGPGAGQLASIRQGALIIGRASVSDLRLQHASISRRHAQLTRDGERFFVRDLGSQNGTYVNQTKIATEIEVELGDQIAVGNAVLVLRGSQNGAGEVWEEPARPARRRSGGKLWRVSVVAGGAGFILAGVLMYALVNMVSVPTYEEVGGTTNDKRASAPSTKPTKSATKTSTPSKPVLPKPPDDARAVLAETKGKDRERDKDRVTEKLRDLPDEPRAEPPAPTSKRTASRTGSRSSSSVYDAEKPEKPERPVKPSKMSSGKRAIFASYESGDVATAIEMAEENEETELSDKLIRFERLYKDAQSALKGRDGVVAIRALSAAIRADEQVARGKGQYAQEMKQKLAELYVLVGMKHLEGDKKDEARKAFAAAVKYDPSNSQASSQLKKLGGGTEESPEEDSEAPPERPAAKSSKKKSTENTTDAIDAAFED